MTGWTEDLLVGIVAGLVATLAWFLVFRLMQPRVRIAPQATWNRSTGYVRVKILNRAKRDLIDIRFQIDVLEPKLDKGREVARPSEILYIRRPIEVLNEPPILLPRKRNDPYHENAYRIVFALDPKSIFEASPNNFLRLQVFGRDAVSGYGRIAMGKFTSMDDFVAGKYITGQTFEIRED